MIMSSQILKELEPIADFLVVRLNVFICSHLLLKVDPYWFVFWIMKSLKEKYNYIEKVGTVPTLLHPYYG